MSPPPSDVWISEPQEAGALGGATGDWTLISCDGQQVSLCLSFFGCKTRKVGGRVAFSSVDKPGGAFSQLNPFRK